MELRVSQEYVLVMNAEELRKLNRCLLAVPEISEYCGEARELSAQIGHLRVAHGKSQWNELQKLAKNLEKAEPGKKPLIPTHWKCQKCQGNLREIRGREDHYDPERIRNDVKCQDCGAEYGVTKAGLVALAIERT